MTDHLTSPILLVIDIEATCWRNKVPPGQESEIIEVGLCAYERVLNCVGRPSSILVQPSRSQVSDFCTRLTTLTQAQLDEYGVSFADACAALRRDHGSHLYGWASWGDYDHKMFVQQCESFGVPFPFGAQHLNIKRRFADLELNGKQMGLRRALQHAGLAIEGTLHRGGDDAYNCARVLAHLVEKHGPNVWA
jgi:inhibitor of KinA sporulation pathway (predicted exonuclease)